MLCGLFLGRSVNRLVKCVALSALRVGHDFERAIENVVSLQELGVFGVIKVGALAL